MFNNKLQNAKNELFLYFRVDEGPVKGSRASFASSVDVYGGYDDDDASLGEYGDGLDGKFTEDGSFIGRYTPDNKYGREATA